MKQLCIILAILLFPAFVFAAACDRSDYTCAEAEVLLDTVNAMDQPVLTTSTPTFAGITLAPAGMADDTCIGFLISATVTTNGYGIGGILAIDGSGNYVMANADTIATKASAVACQAGTGTKVVMKWGYIKNADGYDFTAGDTIYLEETDGTPIDEDNTLPDTTNDIVQQIGEAFDADTFLFNPQEPMVLN